MVDTLTAREAGDQKRVISRMEFDSLMKLQETSRVKSLPVEPVAGNQSGLQEYLWWVALGLLAAVMVLTGILLKGQRKSNGMIRELEKKMSDLGTRSSGDGWNDQAINNKSKYKISVPGLEKKIQALTSQLEKTVTEKEELAQLLHEYTESKLDFESVKHQMMEVYKIRNYPGFDKEKSETDIVRSLLETERTVAVYAYEHFLKPVLAIADANKNNPARMNPEEREKMLDLLISLSLLYSEYLYLRIQDLSIGGRIAERIGNLRNGNNIDPAQLKKLNVEHGSRALVLRMVLDKSNVQHLSYPVFDETNLNLS
jgi:hypothetical protein